jgi:elongation factor P
MATTSDFRTGMTLDYEGQLFTLVEFQHVKPGKGGAFVRTKLKNVRTGAVLDRTFRAGERISEARLEYRPAQFLYRDGDDLVLMDTETYDQVHVPATILGDEGAFLVENMVLTLATLDELPITVSVPNFVQMRITHTEPGLRGDTATGATKPATVESGASINVPLFLEVGDVVKIDTRTGRYLERVGRA